MSKYCKTASGLAGVICEVMNLFYKKDEAGAFRMELVLSLEKIKFDGKRWVLKKKGE